MTFWQTKFTIQKDRVNLRIILSFLVILLISITSFFSISHADTGDDLNRIKQKIKKEQRLKEIYTLQFKALEFEAKSIRLHLINAARRTQDQEFLISQLNRRLTELEDDVAYRRNLLKQRSKQLSTTLSALTKLSNNTTSAFFMFPGSPRQSVQSAILLKSAVPALRERASQLKEELKTLSNVENELKVQLSTLEVANDKLLSEQSELERLVAVKNRLAKRQSERQKQVEERIEKLVTEASSLQDLVQKLKEQRPKKRPELKPKNNINNNNNEIASLTTDRFLNSRPRNIQPFPKKGKIPLPATGRIVQKYGQNLGFGQTAKGIKIKTRPGAQVIASHDAQVAFAGPFRDHGMIVILEHEGDYHTILSGFDSTNVVSEQWVLAGEPIGTMSTKAKNPLELYVELRRAGNPLNPLRWFKRR